ALNACEIGSAAVLLAERRSREAGQRLEKVVSALESYADATHKELFAVALRFQAQALLDAGDEREAENALQKSATILKDLGPDASVQLAYTMADLCGLYLSSGRLSEAEKHITSALSIAGRALGSDSAEYTRVDMIYQMCLPMQEEHRLDYAKEGIQKMQYF